MLLSSQFRNEWIQQISAHQAHLIPVDEVKKHNIWFEYLFNASKPVESTYRCRLCMKYYDKFGLEGRYRSALADEKGTLKKYKFDNKRSIAEHANIPGHKAVIQLLQDKRLIFHQYLFIFKILEFF